MSQSEHHHQQQPDVLHRKSQDDKHDKVIETGVNQSTTTSTTDSNVSVTTLSTSLFSLSPMTDRSAATKSNYIDPTWFESPVQQLTNISGGTAPFYRILLTEIGRIQTSMKTPLRMLDEQEQDKQHPKELNSKTYYIGKDLSHAVDEFEFYEQLLYIKLHQLEINNNGIGILLPFVFDYLGVVKVLTTAGTCSTSSISPPTTDVSTSTEQLTAVTDTLSSVNFNNETDDSINRSNSNTNDDKDTSSTIKELLVLQNLRNDYTSFRMIDIKIGQQTSQGGWQGKSHLASMKQSVIDNLSNSMNDGYRLEGFDNYPPVIESMNPLLDVLRISSTSTSTMNNETSSSSIKASNVVGGSSFSSSQQPLSSSVFSSSSSSNVTVWGHKVSDKELKKARRIMLQTFTGSEIIRLLIDVHHDQVQQIQQPTTNSDNEKEQQLYTSVEIAEIILHELVVRLVRLAILCHRIKIPQKWIGSSVALGYDAGLYPLTNDRRVGEQAIRSKVITNIFDWGRSELLTEDQYNQMTAADQTDRQKFWNNYRNAIDQLSYNAVREYYNHFTTNNQQQWKEISIQVMDYDSLGPDDYLGTVTIPFPDVNSTNGVNTNEAADLHSFQLHNGRQGILKKNCGILYCSIKWIVLSNDSRLVGMWQIHISHATNLPVRDITNTSDPYCIITAYSHVDNESERSNNKRNQNTSVRTFQQSTCIIPRTINPVWNEFFDIPVVDQSKNYLTKSFEEEGVFLGETLHDNHDSDRNPDLGRIFQFSSSSSFFSQSNKNNKDTDQKLVTDWSCCLHNATTRSFI
jgi:C2 domain